MKVDKILVTEMYRGVKSRQTFICGSCKLGAPSAAKFCPYCGGEFRDGHVEEVVTR